MLKQDYIEKIAAYIVEDWNAADALGYSAGYWLAESQFRAADLY